MIQEIEDVRFSKQRLEEIEQLIQRYPEPRSALLPVLHMAQEDFSYLSMPVQKMVADLLGLRLMHVREVVTFYTMFREQPTGQYRLEVCTNIGCALNGANALVQHMCERLDVAVGETSKDGLFTVTEVECAGACGGAPVVQINHAYHECMDNEKIDAFIDLARKGAKA